jgi:hypothetical protein
LYATGNPPRPESGREFPHKKIVYPLTLEEQRGLTVPILSEILPLVVGNLLK